jgi:hypothetical protein
MRLRSGLFVIVVQIRQVMNAFFGSLQTVKSTKGENDEEARYQHCIDEFTGCMCQPAA